MKKESFIGQMRRRAEFYKKSYDIRLVNNKVLVVLLKISIDHISKKQYG